MRFRGLGRACACAGPAWRAHAVRGLAQARALPDAAPPKREALFFPRRGSSRVNRTPAHDEFAHHTASSRGRSGCVARAATCPP